MAKKKLSAAVLAHLKIAAIGPATKKAIEKHGLTVTVTPKEYIAESVVSALRRRVKGKRVLLVRAKVARDVIPRELRKAGAEVDVVEAYETVVPESSEKRLRAAAREQDTQAARHHVHQFFDGEELRWAAGIARRAGRSTKINTQSRSAQRFNRSGNFGDAARVRAAGRHRGEGVHNSWTGTGDCGEAGRPGLAVALSNCPANSDCGSGELQVLRLRAHPIGKRADRKGEAGAPLRMTNQEGNLSSTR